MSGGTRQAPAVQACFTAELGTSLQQPPSLSTRQDALTPQYSHHHAMSRIARFGPRCSFAVDRERVPSVPATRSVPTSAPQQCKAVPRRVLLASAAPLAVLSLQPGSSPATSSLTSVLATTACILHRMRSFMLDPHASILMGATRPATPCPHFRPPRWH